jgi:hypothetical protein
VSLVGGGSSSPADNTADGESRGQTPRNAVARGQQHPLLGQER